MYKTFRFDFVETGTIENLGRQPDSFTHEFSASDEKDAEIKAFNLCLQWRGSFSNLREVNKKDV